MEFDLRRRTKKKKALGSAIDVLGSLGTNSRPFSTGTKHKGYSPYRERGGSSKRRSDKEAAKNQAEGKDVLEAIDSANFEKAVRGELKKLKTKSKGRKLGN